MQDHLAFKNHASRTMPVLFCLALALGIFAFIPAGEAVVFTWDGSTDSTWTDPTNWDVGAGYPDGADDTAIIDIDTNTPTVPADLTLGTLRINCDTDADDIEVSTAGDLTVTTLELLVAAASATATDDADLTLGGDLTATTITITVAGAGDAVLAVAANSVLGSPAVTITTSDDGAGQVTCSTGTLTLGAVVLDAANGSLATGDAQITFSSTGTMTASSLTMTADPSDDVGDAVLTAGAATVSITGDVQITDVDTAGDNGFAVITSTGTLNIGGNLTIADGGDDDATGITSSGTVVFNGSAAQTITLTDDTEADYSDFENLTIANSDASGVIAASAIYVDGILTINAGSEFDFATNNKALTAKTTSTINGILDPGTGLLTQTGALTVGSSGLIDMDVAGELNTVAGVTLNGTLRISAGTFDFDDDLTINSTGSLLINGGTVEIADTKAIDASGNGTVSQSAGTLTIQGGFTYTLGSGTNSLTGLTTPGTGDTISITGTGTLDINGTTTVAATDTLSGGSNADFAISGDIDNSADADIDLDGAIDFDGNSTITLGTGGTGSLALGSTTNGITVSGTAAVALADNLGTLTVNGDVTIGSNASLTLGVSGNEHVTFANNATLTNNGTFTATGGAGDKTLLKSGAAGSGTWYLVNNGTTNFTDTVVRDCTYSGTGTIGTATRLLNSTGNNGWPATQFSSPVSDGDAAISSYAPTDITGDTVTYNLYAALDGDLYQSGTITTEPQLNQNEGAAVAGGGIAAGSVWDTNDSLDPTEVPSGNYYVYLIEATEPQAADDYILVSNYVIHIVRAGFIVGADEPLGNNDYSFTAFNVLWTDGGDDESTIELRYSTNGALEDIAAVMNPANSTQITSLAGDAADTYTWDTSALASASGTVYYVYLVNHSGSGSSFHVSDGLTIINGITFTAPADGGSTADTGSTSSTTDHSLYTLSWSGPQTITTFDFDVYASTTEYTTAAELLAATSGVVTVDADKDPLSASQDVSWDLTTTGDSGSFVPEGDYYVYLVADDDNGTSYDELVTATGQVTVAHNPYYYEGNTNVATAITGTAAGNGSADGTTAQGAASLNGTDDYYNGAALTITSGASNGETRLVTDYTGATQTFTVSPAFSNQILTSVGYRITDAVMVSSSADSGASVTTPDTVVLRWAGNDVDDTATSALYYAVSTTTYTSADDIETNATSFATAQAEFDNSHTTWDYYTTSNLVPAGTYYIWAVMTDDSGDKAFKRSGGTVTFAHSAKIRVDTPPIGQTTSYSTKYATIEWTDADYDQSAAVDLYYSTTDIVTGGTGGPVSSTGNLATIIGWGNSARINYDAVAAAEIAIAENTDNSGDRYLVDLGNEFADGQTYYVYAVIDSDDDGTAEYGYQSGPVVITHGSRITMTAPAADDAASSSYTLTWQQEWEGYDATNVPMDVDLYYASVNTNVLANLDNFSPSTTQGIVERDISVDVDADGDVDTTGTAYWDDIVITSTTGATGSGTTLTLVDTNIASYATNYLKGRRLVVTGGSLEGETKTINGNVGSTITVDSAFSAATDTTGVESYKVYIPDGTYYVYGVLDTNAHADIQNRYNASDLDLSTDATDDSITIASTGGAADGSTITFAYSATYHSNSDDYYNGARVTFTSGALVGESRTISDYAEAAGTSTITVASVFSAQVVGGNFRIDRPEDTSVSVGTVTINNYSVHTDMPEEFHSVGDAFNMDLTIDTGGQAITAANIYLDFNTDTLELVDASAPFCIVTDDTTDAAGDSSGTTVNGNAANVSSTIDYYNGDTIIITSGAARGESRTISDYDGAGLFTVSSAFSAQIVSGTTYQINRALSNATNHNAIGSWTGLTIVENTGDDTAGTVNLVMVSGVSDATAFTATSSFISLGLKAKAAGNTEVTYAFDSANNRMTRMVDENGALHTPHNAGSAHVIAEGSATASISGKVALQGRTDHSALVTFELRQPGSLGHYTAYAPTADEDTDTAGVQITTGSDGSFTLSEVPAGEWYLTAKAAHYLRGQNDDSTAITIRPGLDVVDVIIKGYSDANADGDFADSGEEFSYLLAGEAFAGTSTSYEDNQINATDLAAFATYYGQTTAEALTAADINGDGAVNITDFGHIAANWGVSAINPTGASGVSNAAPSNSAASVALYGVPDVLQVGKSYNVTLVARDTSNLKGFSLDIGYDSAKATISNARGAKTFGESGKALFVSKDVKKGVSLGSALLADSTDTGALVQFTLEPTASGQLVLELAQGQLVGRLGTEDILKNRFTLRVIANEPVTESYLAQNFPNPFNPETWIPYALKEASQVEIRIFDSAGHLVRSLDQGFRASAHYTQRGDAAYWDGRNRTGERVASGVYFYQIQAGDFQAMRRMVILK